MLIGTIWGPNYNGKNIEWVKPKKRNIKRNIFNYSTHKLYIKYGNQICHFVGHSKLKPIGCVAFFKIQEESADLTASMASITDAQIMKKDYTIAYTGVKHVSWSIRSNSISKWTTRNWTFFWCGVRRTSIFVV